MRGTSVNGNEVQLAAASDGALEQLRESIYSRAMVALRWVLFCYLCLSSCPIRYDVPVAAKLDNTWMFALNYAAAHHLTMGRDFVWTFGPLAYLLFPFDVGNNLAKGLVFQAALWILLIAILWDLFLRSRFQLRNLALFSALVGLSSLSFHHELYPGAPLLYAGLILLAHFRLRGGMFRYVGALTILGLTPLFQFYQAVIAAGIVVGLGADLAMRRSRNLRTELAMALALPALVAVVGCRLALGSFATTKDYLKWSVELTRGYTAAMSIVRAEAQFLAALGLVAVLGIVLVLLARQERETARFFALTLIISLVLSLKHGFVRQDGTHVIQFACFAALALAVMSLGIRLADRFTNIGVAAALILFPILWGISVPRGFLDSVKASSNGIRSSALAWNALHFSQFRRALEAEGRRQFPPGARIEPEIRSIVGHDATAFVSEDYSSAVMDGINLALLPVLQPSTAYTPALDQLNAAWIDNKGPRFLICDGLTVDLRQPWAQTPRTWMEVYRWYDTRWLGPDHLLLERRAEPRFSRFEPIAHVTARFGQELLLPASPEPVFWTMECRMTPSGELRALFMRVPLVIVGVKERSGPTWWGRAIIPVLGAPSLGNKLPGSLAEFAEVFSDSKPPDFLVVSLEFVTLGKSVYAPDCGVEFLRTVR